MNYDAPSHSAPFISKFLLSAIAGMIASSAVLCAQTPDLSDLPAYKPDLKVEGSIKIFGSYLKGNIELLEKGFLKFHPDAQFANDLTSSSEGAMAGLYAARADLAPAGDDAKISDVMPFYNVFHYLPTEVSVATGGYEARGTLWPMIIVVSKDNPISKLTMDQLDRIFGSERTGGWDGITFSAKYARDPETNIRTWGQLGLTGEWADKQIQTYGYASPGFTVYMERYLFHWVAEKWNPNLRLYVEVHAMEVKGASANDPLLQVISSERMLDDIAKDKFGIGLAAAMHVKDNPGVKPLAIAAKDGGLYVTPSPETVRNRTYPLTRNAYVYLNRAPGRGVDPNVREFLRFVLSREGQQIIADAGMYYPLPPDALSAELKKLE